jgi:hypothetical protein
LLDRLDCDSVLRCLCGRERKNDVPNECTFSRAFAELSESRLPESVHEALIKKSHAGELVGHLSGDATTIESCEKNHPKKQPLSSKFNKKNQVMRDN